MIVNGHGPLDAAIAIVAHIPGKDENDFGVPFVGPSGDLLNEILRAAGIQRSARKVYHNHEGFKVNVESEVYCTNIAKEWPGRDASGKQIQFKSIYYEDKAGYKPKVELLKLYESLAVELHFTKAKVFLACGEEALRALTKKYGIDKWRGSVLECTLVPGRKVVPMLHPVDLFAASQYKPVCIHDAKRALYESKFSEIRRPERRFVLSPTLPQLLEWEERLIAAEWCSFDIETLYGGGHVRILALADKIDEAICLPFMKGREHYWPSVEQEVRAWQALARILAAGSKKVAQNSPFDMSHLMSHGIEINNMYHDTMFAASVIYPELEKGLGFLGSLYTHELYWKDMGKRHKRKKKADKEIWTPQQAEEDFVKFQTYCCLDATVTLEVAFGQIEDFKSHAAARKGMTL